MPSLWVDLMGCQVRYYGNKYRTRVIEAGEGEPLILIHGIGGHAEAYSRNLARLGQHFHAMAMDLVWHGLSVKPPWNSDPIPTYALQVVDLMDSLGIERAHIEGESLGGWIALWMGLHHPERVKRLVLNTAAGVKFKPGTVKEQPKEAMELPRQRSLEAIRNPTRETIRKRLEWLMAAPDRVTEELIEVRMKIYTDPETQVALAQVFSNAFGFGVLEKFRIAEEDLGKIQSSALVLWTDHNPGMGETVGRRLADLIPGAKFYLIKDAGHWPQWEQPEEHDRVVISFLQGSF